MRRDPRRRCPSRRRGANHTRCVCGTDCGTDTDGQHSVVLYGQFGGALRVCVDYGPFVKCAVPAELKRSCAKTTDRNCRANAERGRGACVVVRSLRHESVGKHSVWHLIRYCVFQVAAVVAGFAGEKRSWGGGSVDPGDAERGVAATLGAEGEIITGYRRRSHVATHPIVAGRRRGLRLAWFGRRKVTLEQVRERVRSAPASSLGNVLCFKVECRDGLEAVRGACVRRPSVEKLGAGEGLREGAADAATRQMTKI